jgi:hypothetical protein
MEWISIQTFPPPDYPGLLESFISSFSISPAGHRKEGVSLTVGNYLDLDLFSRTILVRSGPLSEPIVASCILSFAFLQASGYPPVTGLLFRQAVNPITHIRMPHHLRIRFCPFPASDCLVFSQLSSSFSRCLVSLGIVNAVRADAAGNYGSNISSIVADH